MMRFLKPSFQVKVVVGVALLVLVVLASVICLNIVYQKRQMVAQFDASANTLAEAIYSSIVYPMAIGDSETIKRHMEEFAKNNKEVKIYVFGFGKLVSYASEAETINTDLSQNINSHQLAQALNLLLASGQVPTSSYNDYKGGIHYITLLRPLVNEGRCHQCHGTNHAVLGGLLVEQESEGMLSALHAMRDKSVLIGVLGSVLIVLFLVLTISQLITRRESEKRVCEIFDFLPDATFGIDLEGKVIAWNRAIEEMTGIKAESILGKGEYEYALPFYGIRRPMLIDMALNFDEACRESE